MTLRRACILGASGGIGAALCSQVAQTGSEITVYAGSRSVIETQAENVIPFRFDLEDENSIEQAAAAIGKEGPLDLVIVATGVLHGEDFGPEKTWRSLNAENMARVFAVNTFGPAIVARHFLPLLRADARSVFAAISARIGSISDNRIGGWHSYRASKAALNMLIRNFAIELSRTNDKALAVALHPGTVDTSLSQPFQGNVPEGKLFTPEYSAGKLLAVLDALGPDDSGKHFAWDGKEIPA